MAEMAAMVGAGLGLNAGPGNDAVLPPVQAAVGQP